VALSRKQSLFLFVMIAILFVLLRGIHLSHAYWIDERFSAMLATQPLTRIPALCARDVNPPLYFLLLRCWNGLGMIFSGARSREKDVVVLNYRLERFTEHGVFTVQRPATGEVMEISGIWEPEWQEFNLAPLWFLRSLSILAGLASLVLLYRIAGLLFPEDRAAALLSGLFLSVSAFSIFWDTTMRHYSLSGALTLCVLWLLIAGRERQTLLGYVLLGVLLFLSFVTNYVSFYFIPAHCVFIFLMTRWRGTAGRFFAVLVISAAIFFLLWGWTLSQQSSLSYARGIELTRLGSRLLRNLYRGSGFYWHLMTSYQPWQHLDAYDRLLFYPLFLTFGALMASGIWLTVRKRERSDVVVLVYVFTPVIVPVLVNTVRPNTLPFQARHFYPVLPFLALLLARGLSWLFKVKSSEFRVES
jgi:uncharacterized membrane protein